MSAADALAVSMLVMLTLAFVTLLTIFYSLKKNAGKTDEIEELMAEIDEPEKAPSRKPAPRQAWEKDADWWKKN